MPVPEGDYACETSWDMDEINPDVPAESGIDLCRRTLWFQDDLEFLCKKYYLLDECKFYPEIVDVSRFSDEKQEIYAKTSREFYFKVFEPKYSEEEVVSSDSDLDDMDSTELDFDST